MSKSAGKDASVQRESYDVQLQLYEKLVATNPLVARKGDTMPYTSVNGHMFSSLGKDGVLSLRLPAGVREAFLKKYDSRGCPRRTESFGASMWMFPVRCSQKLRN